jgi:hypothetical protein
MNETPTDIRVVTDDSLGTGMILDADYLDADAAPADAPAPQPPPPAIDGGDDDDDELTRLIASQADQKTDQWALDEKDYNPRDDSEGHVWDPLAVDAYSQQVAAMSAIDSSSENVQKISHFFDLCFADAGLSDKKRALALLGLDQDAVSNMDYQSINDLFYDKMTVITVAMDLVVRQEDMQEVQKKQVLAAARATIGQMMALNDFLILKLKLATGLQGCMSVKSDSLAKWRYMPPTEAKINDVQRLYRLAMDEAAKQSLCRYKKSFMRRIVTSEGLITNAFTKVSDFKDFVYNLSKSPDPMLQHLCTRSAKIMDSVAELMEKMREPTVPWLTPDKHVFAFANGTLMCEEEKFVKYNKSGPPILSDGHQCPTACNFHDQPLDPRWLDDSPGSPFEDWWNIPTPTMDKMMEQQQLGNDVMRVYFSFLGRCLYYIREHDNWQVFLWVRGPANTGKSTLIKFVGDWFASDDVGILSSNVEEKFGPSELVDKFVIIGDDIGEKFTLDQMTFQKMASGLAVSLAVKNGSPVVERPWRIQILLNGNILPVSYTDNAGSFSRRLVIIHYKYMVQQIDPTLGEKLMTEVAAAIVKCNRAYRNMVRRFDHLLEVVPPVTFWEALPRIFTTEKQNVQQSSNPLVAFLSCGFLRMQRGAYMPRSSFVEDLKRFCDSNGMRMPRFVPSHYEGVFGVYNLTLLPRSHPLEYPRPTKSELARRKAEREATIREVRPYRAQTGRKVDIQYIMGCDRATEAASIEDAAFVQPVILIPPLQAPAADPGRRRESPVPVITAAAADPGLGHKRPNTNPTIEPEPPTRRLKF